ncbi:MAG: DUF2141 domain-containing protein [Candidatus Aegiribacteria sp.]|nr:DUF2141 domain-containing protein [Candidatus Aegiribacteria sp.]
MKKVNDRMEMRHDLKAIIAIQGMLLALLLVPVTVFGQDVESESGTEEQTGTIVVTIEDLRNSDGNVRVALWSSEDGFLRDPDSAYRRVMSVIEGETVEFVFADLPFGEYAVSAFHDENGDGKNNRNLFGKPTEGYCISNGVRGGMSGPPGFDDASFILETEEMPVTMEIEY